MKIALTLLFLAMFAGCGWASEEYDHKYKRGDIVCMILDGQKVMVLNVYKYHHGIDVRVAAGETGGGLFSNSTIKPYARIFITEGEVQDCPQ